MIYGANHQLRTVNVFESFPCFVEYSKNDEIRLRELVYQVKVVKHQYPEERLYVNKRKVFLSKKDLARAIKEREIIKQVYKKSLKDRILFTNAFIKPLLRVLAAQHALPRR